MYSVENIILPTGIYNDMVEHAREGAPNEICGILAGQGSRVERIFRMTNSEPSPVSYFMEPGEQFRIMKEMRADGLQMLAIYHSHPACAPYPSAKDVKLAFYDDAVYIIIGFVEREHPDVRAFRIVQEKVNEIEIELQ